MKKAHTMFAALLFAAASTAPLLAQDVPCPTAHTGAGWCASTVPAGTLDQGDFVPTGDDTFSFGVGGTGFQQLDDYDPLIGPRLAAIANDADDLRGDGYVNVLILGAERQPSR